MKIKKPYTAPAISCNTLDLETGIAAGSVLFNPVANQEEQNRKSESFESNGEFEIDWQVNL